MTMKDVELKLLSELMKNSRRSDRDLAKTIGISQPTATRIRSKLEKQGYIREYTIIPDFHQLGYEIAALTFANLKEEPTPEEIDKVRQIEREMKKKTAFQSIMIAKGLGLGYEIVIAAFHENYASFMDFIQMIKQCSFVDPSSVDSFVISLTDEHYRHLTFATLAKHMLTLKKNKEK